LSSHGLMMWQMAGKWVLGVSHVWDILLEFLGYNFVSGFRTLKSKNLKKTKKHNFFQPGIDNKNK